MADSNEAARAIAELNDTELKGRNIKVNEAREQGPGPRCGSSGDRGGRGGRGGGGGGAGRPAVVAA